MSDIMLPARQRHPRPTHAVEPEILKPGEDSGSAHRAWNTRFASFSYTGLQGSDGCLPGYITLFLMGVCLVQYGLLAAIGFGVFYAIGSGAVAVARLQSAMQGRMSPLLDPATATGRWTPRCAVWALCFWITTWLAA